MFYFFLLFYVAQLFHCFKLKDDFVSNRILALRLMLAYGERILDKLSLEADNENVMSDFVMGQEKHDVARTFSALLQLVIVVIYVC